MQLTGEHELALEQNIVWEQITNPEMLKQSIPGCEKFEKVGGNEFDIAIVTKIGPIKTRFQGKVFMEDTQPPNSYRLVGTGSGGSAGSAKGESFITLKAGDNDTTILNYESSVSVSGKLAQIGVKMIDGTAKAFANEFFTNFTENVKNQNQPGNTSEEPSSQAEAFNVDLLAGNNSYKTLILGLVILVILGGAAFILL